MFTHGPSKITFASKGVRVPLWEAVVCLITSLGHRQEEEPKAELPFFYAAPSGTCDLLWIEELSNVQDDIWGKCHFVDSRTFCPLISRFCLMIRLPMLSKEFVRHKGVFSQPLTKPHGRVIMWTSHVKTSRNFCDP
jgi:hypothetical protein